MTELTDGRVSDRLFSVPYTPKENRKNPGEFIVFSAWYAAKALEMDTGGVVINNAAASAMGSYQDCIKGAPPFRRRYFGCSVTTPFYLMLMEH